MKRITSILVSAMTACSAAGVLLTASASAAEGNMTLEITAAERYFTESALKDAEKVVSGALKLHNYQEIDGLRAVLFTDDGISLANEKEPATPLFGNVSPLITSKAESFNKKNSYVLYQTDVDYELGRCTPFKVSNADGSLVDFDIQIPKGTKAGVYRIGIENDEADDFDGTYATNDGKRPQLDLTECRIVVEPEALRGDTNCDGKVSLEDVKGALDYHVATNLTSIQMDDALSEQTFHTPYIHTAIKAADATQDGTINDRDAMLILKYVSAGLANLPQDWESLQ